MTLEVKPSLEDPFLTVEEVAEIFKVKTYTVREWLKLGKLKGIKISNNQWRILHSEMVAYANKLYGQTKEEKNNE